MTNISDRRKALGLTQSQAARKAKVSLETWRRWERGIPVRERTATRCEAALVSRPDSRPTAVGGAEDPSETDLSAPFLKSWGPDGSQLLSPFEAYALALMLDLWADGDLGEWDPREEPLHDVGPFRHFDKRVMMLVDDNRSFAAMVRERCYLVAKQIEAGLLPFDTVHYLIDEVLVAAAIEEADGYGDDLRDLVPIPLPIVEDDNKDETLQVDGIDWTETACQLDDAIESMHWISPIEDGRAIDHSYLYSGGNLAKLLAAKHPFQWFEYLPPNAVGVDRSRFEGLNDDTWLLSDRALSARTSPDENRGATIHRLIQKDKYQINPSDDADSPAFRAWSDRILVYMKDQELDDARRAQMPDPPWPEQDNDMLGYLVQRAGEVQENEGIRAAILWLATHAWFEGALDERSRQLTGRPSQAT